MFDFMSSGGLSRKKYTKITDSVLFVLLVVSTASALFVIADQHPGVGCARLLGAGWGLRDAVEGGLAGTWHLRIA